MARIDPEKTKERLNGFWSKLYEKDNVLKIISIVAAVIIWAVVSISVYPTIDKIYYNVPIVIELEDTYAQANNLDMTNISEETVTINITGERGQIGDLKAEDFVAVADVSNVMLPKEYTLSLKIMSESGKSFEVLSIEPSTVKVSFDKIISKEFEITPQVEGVTIASGYMSGDPIVTPEKVTVTGPQDTINSITRVCARATIDKELSSTYEFVSTELVLYNDNAVISNDNELLSFDKNSFAMQIPVYVRQTIPLEVNIINAPESFDVESFREKLVFSVDEITLAAPDDKIKDLSSLNIGTINMREVDIGSVFEFKASNFLPDGYENLSQIETVTVTCPSEGLAKKPIAIMGKDIQFINRPVQFEFTPIASGMTLFVVGDEEQIADITKEDIVAQIDLIGFDMQEGDHKMAVDFLITSSDDVWFIGDNGIAAPKIYVTATLTDDADSGDY